jgi:large subunit ribosomal protein L9
MEVILLEKIKYLGNLGDKVVVKPGYGRNYLIPQKKAVPATPKNIETFELRRTELEQAQKDGLVQAQARAKELQEMTVVVTSKVGLEGKLYGSVSASDIAHALNSAGIEQLHLHKNEVRLPQGPIRYVGEYDVPIRLHPEVEVIIKVEVIAET